MVEIFSDPFLLTLFYLLDIYVHTPTLVKYITIYACCFPVKYPLHHQAKIIPAVIWCTCVHTYTPRSGYAVAAVVSARLCLS